MKVLFDGTGPLALYCLKSIISCLGPNNQILVNTYDSDTALISFCQERSIHCTISSYRGEFLEYLIDCSFDFIACVYGRRIFPKILLESLSYSSFNIHPSLLPAYKGCFSSPWHIINGEQISGFTIHEISPGIDEGNILFQENLSIHPEETAYSLYHKIQASVSQSFPTFIDAFIKQRIKPTSQSNKQSSYYPRKLPYNGLIDLSWDNDMVDRFIRAMIFPPFDPAKLILNNKIHMITTLNQYNDLLSRIK